MAFRLELVALLRARKKHWFLPILVMMVAFDALIMGSQGLAAPPFIHALF